MPNMSEKGKMQGDMKPEVKDWHSSQSVYAEDFNQKPNEYVMRKEKQMVKAASKIKKQKYEGRY